ncbi:MAG: hypothetical protein HOI95_26800 [Chromatiales bacterium]|nr:hypothetical protein [Rhodospirillaceae bacterium]MBT6277732.1 hypothetical protein [Chromatiales bacterium]MBT7613375.1 hypothetical protein [Rhodospirillaceae bacterium]
MPGNPSHLVADVVAATDIAIVLNRHDYSGVACAFSAAHITGKPQVAFGNPGPGITNLVTGSRSHLAPPCRSALRYAPVSQPGRPQPPHSNIEGGPPLRGRPVVAQFARIEPTRSGSRF